MELKEKLEELQKALEKKQAEFKEASEQKSKDLDAEIKSLKDEKEDLQKELKSLQEWKVGKDEADKKNQEALDKMQKKDFEPKQEKKSFGERIREGVEEKHDEIEKIIRKDSDAKKTVIELKAVGDITTGNVTGGTAYGDIVQNGIITNPNRRVHIRELVGTGSIGAGTQYVYMREDGDGEGAIKPVAEGDTKPQIDVDLKEASVNIETIAGWLRVTNKAMSNIPGFMSFLQQRLPEKLLSVEDDQLLNGDGVSPNISGITDTGNFTAATTTESVLIDRLTDTLAQLEGDEERLATGILLTPADYYGFFKNKATGSGEYDLPANVTFANGQLYIGGVPVYKSSAANADQFIVGEWDMGSQLLIQNGIRID